MTETLKFERETCGRCGGSGRYSYNQIDGDMCYGCQGKGVKLTKRARIAQQALRDARMVPAGDIKIGDRVRCAGTTIMVRDILSDGGARWLNNETGEWENYIDFKGEKYGFGVHNLETLVERIPVGKEARIEELRAAIAHQNSLTKAGTPRKQKKVA